MISKLLTAEEYCMMMREKFGTKWAVNLLDQVVKYEKYVRLCMEQYRDSVVTEWQRDIIKFDK